jgi:hypothetical protein
MVTSTCDLPNRSINVSILEIELAGAFVVFLVEGAAGGEDSNSHGMFARNECRARLAVSQSKIRKVKK